MLLYESLQEDNILRDKDFEKSYDTTYEKL